MACQQPSDRTQGTPYSISASDVGTLGTGAGGGACKQSRLLGDKFIHHSVRCRSQTCLPTRETVPARKVLPVSLRTYG